MPLSPSATLTLDASHRLCLSLIGALLLGFVLGGKGFAHIGSPPLFISEIVLSASMVLCLIRPVTVGMVSSVLFLLMMFDLLGILRTLPFLGEYGMDALRDGALYGYSLFAMIVAALMSRQEVIIAFLRLFDRVSTVAVILLPLFLILSAQLGNAGSEDVPVIALKSGDVAVHLAGVITFRMVGLGRLASDGRPRWAVLEALFWICCLGAMIWAMANSRGGLLAIVFAVLAVSLLGHGRRKVLGFFAALLLLLFFLAIFDARIDQDRRDLSAEQIIANVTSLSATDMASPSSGRINMATLQSTVRWRLNWWGDIIDDIVFGDHFWAGRGFGINLADLDGYQTNQEMPLRSPHNVFMTVLARMGVPGLALWVALQGSFGFYLIRMILRMRRHQATGWDRLCIWVLAFWIASLVNGSFDVYLEGPQGGIWFWSVFGFGMAVLSVAGSAAFDEAEDRTAMGDAASPARSARLF